MKVKIITPENPIRSTLDRLIVESQEDISKSGYGGSNSEMADSASLRAIGRIGVRMVKEQQDLNKLLERIAAALEKGIWS